MFSVSGARHFVISPCHILPLRQSCHPLPPLFAASSATNATGSLLPHLAELVISALLMPLTQNQLAEHPHL